MIINMFLTYNVPLLSSHFNSKEDAAEVLLDRFLKFVNYTYI